MECFYELLLFGTSCVLLILYQKASALQRQIKAFIIGPGILFCTLSMRIFHSYKDIDKKACLLVSDAFEAYDSFEYGSNAFVVNCKDPETFL